MQQLLIHIVPIVASGYSEFLVFLAASGVLGELLLLLLDLESVDLDSEPLDSEPFEPEDVEPEDVEPEDLESELLEPLSAGLSAALALL